MKYEQATKINELVKDAHKIVIIQADNPDGDSLGSALALEQILGEMGKEPYMYCGVDMPGYLRYLSGWDRVSRDIPNDFDLSIIVDASTISLFEKLLGSHYDKKLASKPCIVLDHHAIVQNEIPFASVMINDSNVSSTGELIYGLSRELSWPFDTTSGSFIMTTILGDTQGLTNAQARASTYRVMAELIDLGVDRPDIEELRKAYSKMPPEIYRYKGKLLERTEFASEGRIATVSIPQEEITKYSALYNPKILVLGDMLQVTDVTVLLIFKTYNDGKVTCAVRCNPGYLIANKIAERFGGGGHPFAAGFKITNGRPFNEVKSECISFATELLDNLEKEHSDETAQHQHA